MNILKPIFYDEFECIGGECPLTCCGGWRIDIDEKTYKSYRKMGSRIARFAKKNIVYGDKWDSYYVKLNDSNGLCPMCDQEQLCYIVREKGADCLCDTCKRFPREFFCGVFGREERYLSCACPRVVELLSKLGTKIRFVTSSINDSEEDGLHIVSKKNAIDLQIREMVFGFVQESEIPLWFRQFYGIYVMEKVKEDYLCGRYEDIRGRLVHLYQRQYWEILYTGLQKTKPDKESQFEIMRRLVNDISEWICVPSFADKYNYMMRMEELIEINANCTFSEWECARKKWNLRRNMLAEENLFAYDCMRGFLPYREFFGEYLLDSYLASLFIQILTHHFQILLFTKYENDEVMGRIIICILDRVFHGVSPFLKKTVENWKEQGLMSMGFLRCLLEI